MKSIDYHVMGFVQRSTLVIALSHIMHLFLYHQMMCSRPLQKGDVVHLKSSHDSLIALVGHQKAGLDNLTGFAPYLLANPLKTVLSIGVS